MSTDSIPDYDVCPVCERPFVKRVLSKLGGTIDHEQDLKQTRTCFWPTTNGSTTMVAVFYHIDDGKTREGTIDLTTGDD